MEGVFHLQLRFLYSYSFVQQQFSSFYVDIYLQTLHEDLRKIFADLLEVVQFDLDQVLALK